MTQQHNNNHAEKDTNRLITDDYECFKDCRNCPFPGAKCYQTKYDHYNTGLLIHKQ